MTGNPPHVRIPDQGDLVRYMDDELDATDRAWVEEWLARTPALQESLERMEDASNIVLRTVSEHPIVPTPPPPDWNTLHRPGRIRWGRAAVLLIAAASLLTAPPIRAALSEGIRAVAGWFSAPAPPSTPPPSDGASALIRALPDGPILTIRIEGAWPGGTLSLAPNSDAFVSAATPPSAEVLFQSGAVVFRFPDTPLGSQSVALRVGVPREVETVGIRIPGEPTREISAPRGGDRLIELPAVSD